MWSNRLLYRTECVKTTWTFRLGLMGCFVALIWLTRGFWVPAIGHSLVCKAEIGPADALLVENFDPNYLVFERAEALYREGLASRVLVPTSSFADGTESRVAKEIVELMVRLARLEKAETIPVREVEPYSLNAASQIREALTKENIRSVAVVTPGFRSRRSALVYRAVLGQAGIAVSCVPVFGRRTPETWASTWHGIQEVTEQFLKLLYYRLYVLPIYAWKNSIGRHG